MIAKMERDLLVVTYKYGVKDAEFRDFDPFRPIDCDVEALCLESCC